MVNNKIRMILLIMVMVIFLMPGCDPGNGVEIVMNDEKYSKEEHEKIVMTTIQTTYSLTSKNVDVTIKNNTFDTVYAGFDYSIEYYNGTSWNELSLDIIYLLSRITISAGI